VLSLPLRRLANRSTVSTAMSLAKEDIQLGLRARQGIW
jgi:hypothetical protein